MTNVTFVIVLGVFAVIAGVSLLYAFNSAKKGKKSILSAEEPVSRQPEPVKVAPTTSAALNVSQEAQVIEARNAAKEIILEAKDMAIKIKTEAESAARKIREQDTQLERELLARTSQLEFKEKEVETKLRTLKQAKEAIDKKEEEIQVLYNDSSLQSIFAKDQDKPDLPKGKQVFEIFPQLN